MSARSVSWVPMLFALGGCSADYHHFTKPLFVPQEFYADSFQCRQTSATDAMLVQCMQARGYTMTATDGNRAAINVD